MSSNYDRALNTIFSLYPYALNIEDSAQAIAQHCRDKKVSLRSLSKAKFESFLTFPSTDDLCDRCGAKAPLFHDEGDSVCENCITPLPEDDAPAPKKRTRSSHADCDHPATKVARAKCRRARAKAALFTEIDYLAMNEEEREIIDLLAKDHAPEAITLDMIADHQDTELDA